MEFENFKNDLEFLTRKVQEDLTSWIDKGNKLYGQIFYVPIKTENGYKRGPELFENPVDWKITLREVYGPQLLSFEHKDFLKQYFKKVVTEERYYEELEIFLCDFLQSSFDDKYSILEFSNENTLRAYEYLSSDVIEARVSIPLKNITLVHCLEIENVKIYQLTWEEKVKWLKEDELISKKDRMHSDLNPLNFDGMLELKFYIPGPLGFPPLDGNAQRLSLRVLKILQLYDFSGVTGLLQRYDQKRIGWSNYMSIFSGNSVLSSGSKLVIDDYNDLEKFITKYLNDERFEQGEMKFVLDRLSEAWPNQRSLEFKVFDYISMLEAILIQNGQSELSFRVSVYTANLFGENKEEKIKIYELIKKAYRIRSKVAHCDYEIKDKDKLSGEEMRRIGKIVHQLIKKALDKGLKELRNDALDSLF